VVPNHALYQAKLRPDIIDDLSRLQALCMHKTTSDLAKFSRATKHNVAVKLVATFLASALATGSFSFAQDAAQPSVDVQPQPEQPAEPAVPTPSGSPELPELSKLDEAFKQTSLGKAADEYRIRVEVRRLQNIVVNEPVVVAAKAAAETATTDLEKRQRLRDYYNIYYGRMRSLTSSPETRAAVDKTKGEHLALLNQPRVRHETDAGLPTPSPTRSPHKDKKKSKFSR
jgi:hypothetical protein